MRTGASHTPTNFGQGAPASRSERSDRSSFNQTDGRSLVSSRIVEVARDVLDADEAADLESFLGRLAS